MVTPISYAAPKKSKLSLFRFAKSSKSSNTPAAAQTSVHQPHRDATPGQPAAVVPVLYQYPSSTNLPTYDDDGYTYATYPALTRLQTDLSASKHSRQRSHFSIPDVVVTTCEEEGQRDVVQLCIPPSKRRSYLVHNLSQDFTSCASSRKIASRPTPLITLHKDGANAMTKSASLSSLGSPICPDTPSSTLSKRSRKRSFGRLFGRKSLESSPPVPGGLLFSAHGLPTPPITPTSPSKKELKAKAKHELALIKQLERVDRLVKEHDTKAQKEREKRDRNRERERVESIKEDASGSGRGGSMDLLRRRRSSRKTIFQAASKATTSAPLARRTSVKAAAPAAAAGDSTTYVYERRGSEPILSNTPAVRQHKTSPFSVDLPPCERLPLYPQSTQGTVEADAPCSLPASADVTLAANEDPDDDTLRQWTQTGWTNFQDEFSGGPLPSLIHPSGTASTLASSQLEHDDVERRIKIERRASVQRILALGEATTKARRMSRQTAVTVAVAGGGKRRSSVFDSVDGLSQSESSKRSSIASSRRRSFISKIVDEEGWSIVPSGDKGQAEDGEWARVDDSMVAQPDVDGDGDDWVEDSPAPLTGSESEMDLVLADLKAAQQADHGRLELGHGQEESGEKTPTQEVVHDPFKTTNRSPPTSTRPIRRAEEPCSPAKQSHSSSISSVDSFASLSSGTATTEPFFSPDQAESPMLRGEGKSSDAKQFRLSLTLAPLQPIELCGSDDWGF